MTGPSTSLPTGRQYSGGAVGLTVFAGIMMMMIGAFHAVQGLVALFNDTFYVVGKEYVFQFDVTAWGWIHLLLGIVVAIAGAGLFTGAVWARTIGVIFAVVSGIASFMWLPYYPVWGLIVIALDVFVVWALIAHGRDIAET